MNIEYRTLNIECRTKRGERSQAVKSESGFSLLEILVAVTIMGLAYVAILQSFSLSARNIHFMDESRTELLASTLAFEKQLIAMGQAEQGDMAEGGEVLVDGSSYELVLVTDENNDFMTILLNKK
nr:prepilin-type N-terminal cleavage/methylation domain-containing protein [Desulfobulbaceae bacterium]